MYTKNYFKILSTAALILFSLSACSSKDEEETEVTSGSSVTCSVTGSIASGNVNAANTAVVVSNIVVNSTGGSSGSYLLTLPNGATGTVGAYYASTGSLTLTTGASGGIYAQFSVQDTASGGDSGVCYLTLSGSSTSGVVSISPSATSVVKGSSITLTATASSVVSPVFSFTSSSSYPGNVSLVNNSNGFATISSSVAQTVTVTVTMISNSSGVASSSQSISLYFTESGSSGTATLSLSTSNSAPAVGTTVYLYASASGISDPVYTFSYVGSYPTGATGSYSGAVMTLTSTASGTITIQARAVSASNSALYAEAQFAITFSGGTSSTSLTCTLGHQSGVFYARSNIGFYISSNTGEALRLVYWNPGEAWDNGIAPSFPIVLPQSGSYSYFYGNYSYSGVKNVSVLVESVSRPGVYCNGGAYLSDTVTIY